MRTLLRPSGVSLVGGGGDEEDANGDGDDDPDKPAAFDLGGVDVGAWPVTRGVLQSLQVLHSSLWCVALQVATWHVHATFFLSEGGVEVFACFLRLVTSLVSAVICFASWASLPLLSGRCVRGSWHVLQ